MRSGEQRRRRYAAADNFTERGSIRYTGDDYRAVIDPHGHACRKMKLLVDPKV